MQQSSIDDIKKLRSTLNAAFPIHLLHSLSRDEAVVGLLKAAEQYKGFLLLKLLADSMTVPESLVLVQQALDAMQFSMRLIYAECKDRPAVTTRENAVKLSVNFLNISEDFAKAESMLNLVSGGWAQLDRKPETSLRFSFVNSDRHANEVEVANQLFNSSSHPGVAHKQPNPGALSNAVRMAKGARTTGYKITSKEFELLRSNYDSEKWWIWNIDPTVDLGGYTFADLRAFWIALYALTMIHLCVCSKQNRVAEDSIKIKRRPHWENELCRRSKLSKSVVANILDDLIYAPNLYEPGAQRPTISAQPFFCLNGDYLALSNAIVLTANIERNVWDLVSIKRKTLFSKIECRKEDYWATSVLIPWLQSLNLFGWDSFVFKKDGTTNGDLDLLILDMDDKFGLNCQLKWIKGHNSLAEVNTVNKTLLKGIQQAKDSMSWLRTYPDAVLMRTGLSKDELSTYQLESLLISRNSLGGVLVQDSEVPIINEFLMQLILDEPHHQSLRTLWKVAKQKVYLPLLDKHFSLKTWSFDVAGLNWLSDRMTAVTKTDWDPISDIRFANLKDV